MRRKLLILNWRDPWHPQAGGAELVTHRVAERLAAAGWAVEWFSGAYADADAREERDGIQFIRAGSQATVHLEAFRRYRGSQVFDVAVDQVNTIPFFGSRYLVCPVVALIHQLARAVWFYEVPQPLSTIGYILEPLYMRAYRRSPIITISRSTENDLRSLGCEGPISVIPMAVDEPADDSVPTKAEPPEILAVGRVTPSKRLEHMIDAAAVMAARGWQGMLNIAGGGDERYVSHLRRRAEQRIPGRVRFHGRISDVQRRELMRRSSVLWMTSVREGWGLVVTEAARHGTPSVTYDIQGLRDSVHDGSTGLLTESRPTDLAEGTRRLLEERERFSRAALENSRSCSWNETTVAFERAILNAVGC